MLVAILGAPTSSGNRGVLALGASLSSLILNAHPDARIVLLNGQQQPTPLQIQHRGNRISIPVIGYRLSPKAPLRDQLLWIAAMSLVYRLLPVPALRKRITDSVPWIKALSECDIAGDVRGGDSFSDIYGIKRFVFGFIAAATVLLVHGKLVQFPQTYGPYKSLLSRILARILLKNSTTIVARDKHSREVASSLAGSAKQVKLSPDVAFSLEAVRPSRIALDPPEDSIPSGEIIGINVNGLMYNGGYTRSNMFGLKLDYPEYLREVVSSLARVSDCRIWLVPHTYAPIGDVESDNAACATLRASLPPEVAVRVSIVSAEYDQHEIKGVIGHCGFFVGSRMHSCIAALSQGIPCVGVAYSGKFLGVFESVGAGDWVIDGREVSTSEAVSRTTALFVDRAKTREELAPQAASAKAALAEIFGSLVRNEQTVS